MRRKRAIRGPRSLFRDTSGQAIAESVIMLSLFAFAWVLISVANFMTHNQIRTAAAARHAAWMKGNGVNQASEIDNQFFAFNGFSEHTAEIQPIEEVPTIGPLLQILGSAFQVWHTEVHFGGPTVANQYPFILLGPTYQFMQDTGDDLFLDKTYTACEWAEVNDTWGAGEGGIDGIIGLIISLFS